MPESPSNFDPIWNNIYKHGHAQKAPWDSVVSFIYRHRPREKSFPETRILEVGCGTGSNLRFFAHEGFQVFGIDASPAAIETAKNFFKKDGLSGTIKIGNFTALDFKNEAFDMVIDRAALTCTGTSAQKQAISEIHRVLQAGGKFLYTPYASTHSSKVSGTPGPDDLTLGINKGTLVGVGQIRFVAQGDLKDLFPADQWKIISAEYQTSQNIMEPAETNLHSNWRVIAEKQ